MQSALRECSVGCLCVGAVEILIELRLVCFPKSEFNVPRHEVRKTTTCVFDTVILFFQVLFELTGVSRSVISANFSTGGTFQLLPNIKISNFKSCIHTFFQAG